MDQSLCHNMKEVCIERIAIPLNIFKGTIQFKEYQILPKECFNKNIFQPLYLNKIVSCMAQNFEANPKPFAARKQKSPEKINTSAILSASVKHVTDKEFYLFMKDRVSQTFSLHLFLGYHVYQTPSYRDSNFDQNRNSYNYIDVKRQLFTYSKRYHF